MSHKPTKNQIDFITNMFKYIGGVYVLKVISAITFVYYPIFNVLNITVNPSKLLNVDSVSEYHYKQFIYTLQGYINEVFSDIDATLLNICRMDYKIDHFTEFKDLYIWLLHKSATKYRQLNQYNKYETSVYFNSRTKNIQFYDKEAERSDKLQAVDEKYTNMLRSEIQLKRPYFKYQLSAYGVCRNQLINYWTEKDRDFVFNEILKPIVFIGDYYTIYQSNKILKEHYSNTMVSRLLEFQKLISRVGISKTKEQYKDQFHVYKKMLEAPEVNINPILIPKNNSFGVSYLPNLFSFTNENIYLIKDWAGIKAS